METEIILSTRKFLSCWTRLPDYDQIKKEVRECPDVEKLKALIFSDWPATEIFPPSFDALAQKVHKTVWLIISSVFGSCDL